MSLTDFVYQWPLVNRISNPRGTFPIKKNLLAFFRIITAESETYKDCNSCCNQKFSKNNGRIPDFKIKMTD